MTKIVTITELAEALHAYGQELASYDPKDIADEEGNATGDVRLQLIDGSWALHTGDASYDQDHRGAWGASSISAGATMKECRETAKDLIAEAEESLAETE
jgi:hypothetical protein